MTDYEPYVAEPAEPRPRPRLARFRPLLVTLLLAISGAALAFILIQDRAEQDPSLQVPTEQTEQQSDQTEPGEG